MRYREDRLSPVARLRPVGQTLPERGFRLHVERAREIIDDEQLRPPHERAGGGRALDLTAGEPHTARADQRVESVREAGDILLEHRGAHRAAHRCFDRAETEQDVRLQRIAEEARDLRHVRAPRRDEEGRGVFDLLAVPADLAGVARQQAEQDAEQRRLARADAPGDDRELAAPQRQRDVLDARRTVAGRAAEVIGESDRVEVPQLLDRSLLGGGVHDRPVFQVERRVHDKRRRRHRRRANAHQREHARDGDAQLLVLREEQSEESAELGDEAEVRDEQCEVAHGEAAVAHRARAEQQDEPRSQVDRVPVHRSGEERDLALAEHGATAQLAEPVEVVDDSLLRACDLHRLHGAEDLAKRAGDAAGRDPARRARLLEAPRDDLRHGDDRDERHEDEDRDRRVDAREDPHRRGREDREADHVDGPVAAVLGVLDVVAEDAHRFTR